MFDDILKFLGNASPVIGTILGGPVGAIAGAGIKLIAESVTGDSAPSEIIKKLTTSPELLAQIEQRAQEHEKDILTIHADDRKNARSQTVELAKAGSKIAWGAPIVSLFIVCGYFIVLDMLFFVKADFPPNVFQLLNVLFGALQISVGQVCNYWLGSSRGSDVKTAMLGSK